MQASNVSLCARLALAPRRTAAGLSLELIAVSAI
jgi:hypothetical protein